MDNDITGLKTPNSDLKVRADVIDAGGLMITEVMPDPTKVADASGEWFEVYNGGASQVNLKNYKIVSAAGLSASESHTIASDVIVDPGEYVVFGNNANTATNGGVPVAYSYGGSIALNNGSSTSANEWLALRTPANVTLDSVAYATRVLPAAPGPYTPPSGSSRAVIDLAGDNTILSGSAWATSVTPYGLGDKGTPGQPNTGGAPASVSVRVSWVTPGTTFRVTASAFDADGKPSATNFTWTSLDPSIATVDAITGVATGVALGVGTLKATASNGVFGTAPLFVVNPGDVASISLSINDPAQIPVGYTKPIFPTTRTTTNAIVTPALVWTTSDNSIATVDNLGYVTGTGVGSVKVRATAPNGVYSEVTVNVIPATAATTAVYRNHLEFGAPLNVPAGEVVLNKTQYVSGYNPTRGGPDWVSWNINSSQFGAAPRCDCFSADLTLPNDVYHVVDFDYRNGGYDRGHMVQSESRTTTDQENATTFLLTNILPQAAANNQGPWSKFENALNDMARNDGKEIYVVAGGIYSDTARTLKNEGKVLIPITTWKVAVIMPGGEGLANVQSPSDLTVIAINMPNDTSVAKGDTFRNSAWQSYQISVDSLESLTGYDFLSLIPNPLEEIIESGDSYPTASVSVPATGTEGSSVALDASASTDPDVGDVLTYAWTFGDGNTGIGAAPSHTYTDNGIYNVSVIVTDSKGAADTASASISISNANPVVASFSGATILPGETYAASGTFSDAGSGDTWTATVNYGDGSGVQPLTLTGNSFSLSHTYASAGSFSVTVVVTDDDTGSGSNGATVTVLSIDGGFDALNGMVDGLASVLGAGETNALKAKLKAASQSYGKANTSAALGSLGAFINQVNAKVNAGQLTAAQGQALIDYANRLIEAIS
jgi:DNA/RNA endonuclease G (NUC1)